VLVVDDDEGNRATLSELLALSGHRVREAESGAAAVARAQEEPYDVALVDLAMPGMSGVEVAERLKALHPALRIALVTGWEPESAAPPPEGVETIFRKPIDVRAIQAFVAPR
jgi:CheY-like chemotaxis protein